jgi:hypothetical protein
MPSYPKHIQRELLRINQQWYSKGIPEWLPFGQGNKEAYLPVQDPLKDLPFPIE